MTLSDRENKAYRDLQEFNATLERKYYPNTTGCVMISRKDISDGDYKKHKAFYVIWEAIAKQLLLEG